MLTAWREAQFLAKLSTIRGYQRGGELNKHKLPVCYFYMVNQS